MSRKIVSSHCGCRTLLPLGALLLLSTPGTAFAFDLALKLEPGLAIPLSAPQTDHYDVGGAQALKLLFGVTPFLDVGPTASFMLLPADVEGDESGVGWGLGVGARLKRPHDAKTYYGISPWFDVDLLYVRTGDLNRPGFDAAIGASVPVNELRSFWVGPFVRYLQILQSQRIGFDSHDAKILIAGVSLEFGTGIKENRVETAPLAAEPEPEPRVCPPAEVRTVTSCPDGDGDQIPDTIDRCPEASGVMENFGCPKYEKVVVQPDKLELKEKLYFAWDQATLEPASFPVLEEVAQALKDNKGFRVQIEGHSDSSGGNDHNQSLSEQRASAVLDFLASRGVPKDRLVSKGLSSSVPTDTNDTPEGREKNRRVEFVVHFVRLDSTGENN